MPARARAGAPNQTQYKTESVCIQKRVRGARFHEPGRDARPILAVQSDIYVEMSTFRPRQLQPNVTPDEVFMAL